MLSSPASRLLQKKRGLCSFVIPAKAGIHDHFSKLLNGSPTKPGMTNAFLQFWSTFLHGNDTGKIEF